MDGVISYKHMSPTIHVSRNMDRGGLMTGSHGRQLSKIRTRYIRRKVSTVCWSTYIQKRPNIGNALRGLFTGRQSEKDGSNKARVLSHMSLGVISTKHGVRRTNLTII